ncbi:MAG: hypothetical protein ABI835_11085 [Chloroflexota bacterium]
MQELPDQQFDAQIARILKFKPVVTPVQRQTARALLLQRAADQAMLPPLTIAEAEPITFRDHAYTFGQRSLRVFHFLFTDSSMYERARRPPRFYEFHNAHGRYTFTVLHMSA